MSDDIIAFKKGRLLSPPRSPAMRHPLRSNRIARGVVIGLALLAFWWFAPTPHRTPVDYLPCQHLQGASDTLVIMKTGVTEVQDRLPPHLENTLRCPPHSLIFSDHQELYQDKWQIRDVLANIDPHIKQHNKDFALYRRVQELGRQGLAPTEITGVRGTAMTSAEDKLMVAGWVLDKWKFVPMMTETYRLHPDKKWYVFIESDTFLFWSTTLKYISLLDHTEPHILGHRTTAKSDHPFMQGGAGYVLSQAALKQVAQYIQAHQTELDRFIEGHWAGDIALGHVFIEAGVNMTYSWPTFQPSHFGMVNFGIQQERRRYWCYPTASFHHMTPETIEDLWSMEQRWLKEEDVPNNPWHSLRLLDVFNNVILPRMRFPKLDWDNQSNILKENAQSIDDCQQECHDLSTCLQYSFDPGSLECRISIWPKYGQATLGSRIYSNWMFDRVERWRDAQPTCVGESFLFYGDVDEYL